MTQTPASLVVVDKPAGVSSHYVVSKARRALGTKRVGHAGTLDPMATGVLVLGVGRATKLLGYISGDSKTYLATIRLGIGTNTEDAEGELVSAPGFCLEAENVSAGSPLVPGDRLLEPVVAAMDRLTGPISQVPSSVSAIKVDGKRAYALVRQGEEVQLSARPVTINSFELLGARRTFAHDTPVVDLDVCVDCSSGTYVRALARDLGVALGTQAHLTALRRTRVGRWTLDQAVTLAGLEDGEAKLVPMANAVLDQFPCQLVDAKAERALLDGKRVDAPKELPETELVCLASRERPDDPFAIARRCGDVFKSVLQLKVGK